MRVISSKRTVSGLPDYRRHSAPCITLITSAVRLPTSFGEEAYTWFRGHSLGRERTSTQAGVSA